MRQLRQGREPDPGRRDRRFESASSTRARQMSICGSLLAALLIGVGAASPAVAQAPLAEPGMRAQATLVQGDRVRWAPGAAGRWQVGDLFALRADTLYVRTFDDPRLAVPLDRLDSLQVSSIDRGVMGKSIGIGAGLGAAVGIGIGFIGRSISQSDGGGTITTTDAIVFGGPLDRRRVSGRGRRPGIGCTTGPPRIVGLTRGHFDTHGLHNWLTARHGGRAGPL